MAKNDNRQTRACILSAILGAALCALAPAAPAANGGGPMMIDRAVAEVGGRKITLSEVMAAVRDRLFEERRAPSESEMPELYASALSNLVARQLVLLEYGRSEVKIPEWYLNQRIDRIVENNFGGDKSRLVAALAERGMSYPDWRRDRNEDTIVGTMRQQFVDKSVAVRPADMERVYRERYATNTLPGRVKVSMIMLKAGDDGEDAAIAKAAEIMSKLSTGGSFAALARTHSMESHAEKGGSWGYIEPEDEFRPELAAALAGIGVGQVAGPVAAGGYVYLLRKDDERDDLSVPFEIVRDEIEQELMEQAAEERFQAWVRHLATKYTVRTYQAQ
ncbi:MAG: peptidylprolyl isomerase [Kiritimatiellae bacterium]|nr:peptidylprolyl isomerase [Kiritimatiellia bacterium]